MIQKRSDRFVAVEALSRRHFLKTATATSAVMSFGGVAPQVFCHAAETAKDQQRVLVVVEMAGGNDGLNTVIPIADPIYRQARKELAIPQAAAIKVTDEISLHPSMRSMADLLENDQFAIVQGVGYENPNRSHFESMDIWHSCFRKDQTRIDGWVGRYLETVAAADDPDPAAIHLGHEEQPFALMSREVRVPSVQSLESFRLRNADKPLKEAIEQLAADPRELENDLLGFVQSSTSNALSASRRMEMAAKPSGTSEAFPSSGLGQKLATVAKLIRSGFGTRVYYVRIDGFDTHANQPDAHAGLLREVSEAVSTLVRDVNGQGDGDRVLVMCFSEFGRRVAENASSGTDHGTAGPILLAGNAVNSGLIGEHPSLSDLQQGDLKHHTDFRQVYAAVLEQWLNCPSDTILGGKYEPISILKA